MNDNNTSHKPMRLSPDEHFLHFVVSGLKYIYADITLEEALHLAQLHLSDMEMEDGVDYDNVMRAKTVKEIELQKAMEHAYSQLESRLEMDPLTQMQSDRLTDLVDDLLVEAYEETKFYAKMEFSHMLAGKLEVGEMIWNIISKRPAGNGNTKEL